MESQRVPTFENGGPWNKTGDIIFELRIKLILISTFNFVWHFFRNVRECRTVDPSLLNIVFEMVKIFVSTYNDASWSTVIPYILKLTSKILTVTNL